MNTTISEDIWLATALLHKERPSQPDFHITEIREKVLRLNPKRARQPGLTTHLSSHCVANKPKHGANVRILTETARGRRRLFKPGDSFDPSRATGKYLPEKEHLPADLRSLLGWYTEQYARKQTVTRDQKTRLEQLRRLIGSISKEDLQLMERAIEESFEKVEEDE